MSGIGANSSLFTAFEIICHRLMTCTRDGYSNCMQSLCRRLENLIQSMDDDGDDNGFHICAANASPLSSRARCFFHRVVNAIIGRPTHIVVLPQNTNVVWWLDGFIYSSITCAAITAFFVLVGVIDEAIWGKAFVIISLDWLLLWASLIGFSGDLSLKNNWNLRQGPTPN